MTDTVLILDQQSLDASGGANPEATSQEFSVLNKDELKVQIIGDGSSTDLTGKLLARCNPEKNTFGEYKDVFTSEDFTQLDNNSNVYSVDVRGLTAVKLNVVNGAASPTVFDATGGTE